MSGTQKDTHTCLAREKTAHIDLLGRANSADQGIYWGQNRDETEESGHDRTGPGKPASTA
eukprot:1145381-Pelagomonas_calceolata.AAC.1